MGNCQNEFQNVPEDFEQMIDDDNFVHNSIKAIHKTVRPNSQEVNFGVFTKHISNLQLDKEELHQTIRPFKQPQTINIHQLESHHSDEDEAQRQELDLNFYYSLALPEYSYQSIPQLHAREFDDLQIYDQEDKNGVKYIGEWKNNEVHGNGVMKSNTVKYIGQFMNGVKHFHGREIETSEVYEGQFFHGRRKGKGSRYTPDLEEEGTFDNHLVQGIIRYKNGDVYEGTLQNRKYHGVGKLITNNNTVVYEGDFIQGKMQGKAIVKYSDGKQYEGEFKDGEKSGRGYFRWNDRNSYEGEYLRGRKHGKGRLIRDGIGYDGTFKNGVMDGQMQVYELRGKQKVNSRKEEYRDGGRVNDYEQSISDDLPENWKGAISL